MIKFINGYKKISGFDILSLCCILFLTISTVYPPLRTVGNNAILNIISIMLWCVISFIRKPGYFINLSKNNLYVFLFLILSVGIPYFFGNFVIGNRYLGLAPFLFFFVIYDFHKKIDSSKVIQATIYITMCFAIVTLIVTANELILNPWISRSIKSSGEYTEALLRQGVGGYEFIYFLVYIIIFSLDLFLSTNNKKVKIVCSVVFIVAFYTVIISNYFTALTLCFIGIMLVLIIKSWTSRNKLLLLLSTAFFLIILIFGESMIIEICDYIVNLSPDGKTAIRLSELSNSIISGNDSNLLAGRLPTLELSIEAILNNPLLGLSIKDIQYSGGYILGFGQHSHILDTFALLGFFIGLLFIRAVLAPFLGKLKKENLSLTITTIVITFLLLVMNNATNSIGFAICFLYPVLYDYKTIYL